MPGSLKYQLFRRKMASGGDINTTTGKSTVSIRTCRRLVIYCASHCHLVVYGSTYLQNCSAETASLPYIVDKGMHTSITVKLQYKVAHPNVGSGSSVAPYFLFLPRRGSEQPTVCREINNKLCAKVLFSPFSYLFSSREQWNVSVTYRLGCPLPLRN